MNKVAIYVRVSTDEQRDNGYSIDSQLRMLKEYADKDSILKEEYKDDITYPLQDQNDVLIIKEWTYLLDEPGL